MQVTRTPQTDAAPEKTEGGGEADYEFESQQQERDYRAPIIARRPADETEVSEQLSRTIESEVIPRLMLAHRVDPDWAANAVEAKSEAQVGNVEDFARLVLQDEPDIAVAYIEARRADGVTLERIFLELMAPAARLLGEYWEQDVCDFAQVTVGLSLLQQMLRKYSPASTVDGDANVANRHALVMPAPGEQHTFGICMVEEFMRSGGWRVEHHPAQSSDEIVSLVQDNWYSVVGLSLSSEYFYGRLGECISQIRRSSRNSLVGVMVGGPFFLEHPDLIKSVGADATAVNGPDAVIQARALVHRKQSSG